MRIVHRISVNGTPEIARELVAMGVRLPKGSAIASDLVTIEVEEGQDSWTQLQAWIAMRRPLDIVSTRFSQSEIQTARWLQLESKWHHGYPQPNEEEFGYRNATYATSGYCRQCGIGLKQRAPFQLKGEPAWGRNGILQLNWIFDEFFVTRQVWASVFRPHSISCRPVINGEGLELTSVVQIVIESEVGIMTEGLPSVKCQSCLKPKYLPVTKGKFPPLESEPIAPMARSREYFGSGASANKVVFVSQAIAQALAAEKVLGVSFRPVAG